MSSFIAFETKLGTLPFEHTGFEAEGVPLQFRHVIYSASVIKRRGLDETLAGMYEIDGKKNADVTAGITWPIPSTPPAGSDRPIPASRFGAWPALVSPKTSTSTTYALPAFDLAWTPDDRFDELEVGVQPGYGAIPIGTPVLVLKSQKESASEPIAFVGGLPFISHWRPGPSAIVPTRSTILSDIDAFGKPDPAIFTLESDGWRVTANKTGGGYTPAWVLTGAPTATSAIGPSGYGLCIGRSMPGDPEGGAPSGALVVGIASVEKHPEAPFSVGGPSDSHGEIGPEGLVYVPLHFNPLVNWHLAGTGHDYPMHFEPAPGSWGSDSSIRRKVHLIPISVGGDLKWGWYTTQENMPPAPPGSPRSSRTYWNDVCFPSMGGKPAPRLRPAASGGTPPEQDIRFLDDPGETVVREWAATTPHTWHGEAFGILDNSLTSWQATTTVPASRWEGGAGSGGFVWLPPELDLLDVDAATTADNYTPTASTTYYGLARAKFFIGQSISTVLGKPVDDWELSFDSSSGDVTWAPVDSANAAAPSRRKIVSGILRTTSGRQVKARGTSGNDTIAATDEVLIWDTTSGAAVATMAAGTGSGQIISVNNIGSNNLTMTPAAGNIDGAATVVLAAGGRRQWIDFASNAWRAISA